MKKFALYKLAISNLRRKMVRSILLLLLATIVSGTLLGATIFITGMKNALNIGTYRLGADVLVVPSENEAQARSALLAGKPTSFYMNSSVLEKIKEVEGVEIASPQLFIEPSSFTCCYSVDLFLIAIDPVTDFTVRPWLKNNQHQSLQGNQIIAGRSLPIMTESVIPFFGTLFTVVGTMEPTGMNFFDQSIFMTMDAAYAMAENSITKSMQPLKLEKGIISAVMVKTDGVINPDRVATRIMYALDGVKAIASDEVISTVRKQLSGLLTGIMTVSMVLWAMALFMIGFAFYMIVNERQRELGMLRAMGAKRQHIFLLIVFEAVIITFSGGLAGLGVGFGMLFALQEKIQQSLQLPYILPPPAVVRELVAASLIFSICTGLLSSLIPASLASRLEPYEAIRKGE
ncbi:MAG: FtsX-like permease family protein [Proteobacteria bacterium]|nr:FtsX-like permease family protein [Pseudomonadota bacterium]MBU1686690.1 FtsX-like permease family protein [Pseudomonadota bacterium]